MALSDGFSPGRGGYSAILFPGVAVPTAESGALGKW